MYDSVLEAIGSPLVRVRSPAGATVAAKLEGFNPGGSAKDRPAAAMVATAERDGTLQPGDRVVEPTSGNTGIGLAVACAAKGYDLTLVMPADKSAERRQLLRAYGADIELVDGDISAARERAGELAEQGAVLLGQFRNPANVEAHYRTTAPEILEELDGRAVDALVATVGTGGTITGTARRLLEEFPDMEVVAVEPERNAVLANEVSEGSSDEPSLTTGEAGEDDYQGMGPGFVSELLDTDLLDDVETVPLEEAEVECRRLARREGILVGQSSGAASLAAYRVAERLADPTAECPPAPSRGELDPIPGPEPDGGDPPGRESDGGDLPGSGSNDGDPARPDGGDEYSDCPLVVTVFPDSGERYLSTGLFD